MDFLRYTYLSVAVAVGVPLAGCGGGTDEADPAIEDFPIAYVKRPVSFNNDGTPRSLDTRRLLSFVEGGDVYIKDRAAAAAVERNITFRETGGLGDAKDIESSYDGTRLLFSLRRADPDPNDNIIPTWNIFEYDIPTDTLRQVIGPNAEEGDDVAPCYLPDGRIIFSSNRQNQSRARLLDEGISVPKPEFSSLDEDRRETAFLLHIMNSDGSNIKQISFNQSHDFDPFISSTGKIVFSRWDNMGTRNSVNLYQVNPDGTQLQIYYGAHSHNAMGGGTNTQFFGARELPDGRLMALTKPFSGTFLGGHIALIDTNNYIDNLQPYYMYQGILNGPGQQPVANLNINFSGGPSLSGRFAYAYPLYDGTGRLLVSWSPCRMLVNDEIVPCTSSALNNPDAVEAPPLYGMYVFNSIDDTQLPVSIPEENMVYSEVIALHKKELPPVIYDKIPGIDEELDLQLASENAGLLHIRSVYDFEGNFNSLGTGNPAVASISDFADPLISTADDRPARYLRLFKSASIPDRNTKNIPNTAFGASPAMGMREIIGYVPVQPDGSVIAKVPANIPFSFDVVDRDGMRLHFSYTNSNNQSRNSDTRHDNWLQIKPGETVSCNGCHNHNMAGSHAHAETAPTINLGAAVTGLPFTNTEFFLVAEAGETMAQTLYRYSCINNNCNDITPVGDIAYSDLWTDANVRSKDNDDQILYSSLTTAQPPSYDCQPAWTYLCRTLINYVDHIQPLWEANGCTSCHTSNNGTRVPDGTMQLELTAGNSADEPDHLVSYRELLFPDNEIDPVTLQDRIVLVPQTDADGNIICQTDTNGVPLIDPVTGQCTAPVLVSEFVEIGPVLTTDGARANTLFTQLFAAGGTHQGRLSRAELRLIYEWLDMGAQYYNNPFDPRI